MNRWVAHHRTDAASIALGPGFRAGVILGRNGVLGIGVRSLTVVGVAPEVDLVETVPLSIEGGWAGSLGPVELQGILEVIAERWSPSGAAWAGGWRAGLGLAGGLVVPIAWLLDFRVDFGIEFFTEGHTLGYTFETTRELSPTSRTGAGGPAPASSSGSIFSRNRRRQLASTCL